MTLQVGLMITGTKEDMTVGDVLAALEAVRQRIISNGFETVLDKTWSVTPGYANTPTCKVIMKKKST